MSAPLQTESRGAFALFVASLTRWLPAAQRDAALGPVPQIVVRIGENERGGWSIYAVSPEALVLFGGDGPCGNFGTYADACRRAERDNGWTVQEDAS